MLHSKYAVVYFGALLLVFLVPIGIGVLVPELIGKEGIAVEFGTLIGQIGTGIVAFVAWLKKPLTKVTTGLATLEKVQQEAERAQKTKLEAAKQDPADEELAVLQVKERAAREALRDSEKQLQEAEVELEEAQPSRRLYRLIEERTESGDYRSRLGIISLIRNDFEQLSKLINHESEPSIGEELKKPIPLDRIVLYIDDLDRCPQDRVVEILEAVHLLLAFPIFVVVVGVDPRWLRRSLELHYPHLLTSLSENGNSPRKTSRTRAATPQNYLEKIFQIPFNLRPMGKKGYESLVGKLTAKPGQDMVDENLEGANANNAFQGETETDTPEQTATPAEIDSANANHEQNTPTQTSSQTNQATNQDDLTPAENAEQGNTPDNSQLDANKPDDADLSEYNDEFNDEDEVVLTPPTLELNDFEKEYIASLHLMFNTPRAVKRFINTYRIFRARLSEGLIEKHINTNDEIAEYRCALVLLAIITGFPGLASKVLRLLYAQPANSTWNEFVSALLQSSMSESDFPTNEVPQSLLELEGDWIRMCEALKDLGKDDSLPFDMKTFAKWTPTVARFSFSNVLPPWRALGASATNAPDWMKMSSQAVGKAEEIELEDN